MQETVGLVIRVDGRQIAIGKQQLEEFAAAGGKAEKAVSGLAGETRTNANSALREFAQQVDKADRELRDLYTAEMQAATGLKRVGEQARTTSADLATLYDSYSNDFALAYSASMNGVARSTKLASFEMLYFGRQLGDVATMAAMGASPLAILTTQGAQVAEGFAMVGQRGVTVTQVLKQMAAQTLALAATLAPFVVTIGAVGGAFLLWRKHLDDVAAAIEATTKAQQGQAEGLVSAGEALSKAIAFTEQYGVANEGLSDALDDVLVAQSESYRQTLAGIDPTDRAAKSAAQRAEMERLLAVSILRRAAADAEARAAEAAKDERKARNTARFDGVMAGIGRAWMGAEMPGSVDPLGAADRVRQEAEQRLGVGEKARIAAEERRLAEALGAQADAMMKVGLTAKSAEAAVQNYSGSSGRAARASKGATEAIDEQARAYADLVERLKTPAEKELEQLHTDMETLRTEFDLNRISAEEYREQFDRLWKPQPALVRAVTDEVTALDHSVSRLPTAWEKALEAIEEIEDATRDIRWGFDDIARSIEERDWASVFGGLMRTLKDVRTLWDSGLPGGKSSAAGTVLSSVGGAVGGRAGDWLSAAGSGLSASGAALALGGAIGKLAGPIGIAVTGFTFLSKVLSDGAAKRRAKAEQEANDIARARQVAEERAAKRAELEIELLRVSGDELGALTRERENELKALDSVSAAIQRQIYALEDWQKTVTAAESAVAQAEADLRRAYDIERDRLLGIIGGVDEARQALEQAYSREKAAIEATVSGVEGLIESLRDFRQELNLNPLAQGSLAQGRGAALAQFQAAGPGDAPGAGRAFLDASMASARTALDFQRDRALVARAIDDMTATAEMQLTDAEKQLAALDKQVAGLLAANDNLLSVEAAIRNLETAEQAAAVATAQLAALDAQVGALINLNAGFMSVAQAIDNLASAQQALAAAQAAKPDASAGGAGSAYEAVGFDGYVDRNADLAALYAAGTGMARGRSKTEFGQYHWERYGQAEDRFYRPFANGGVFGGGVVSGPTAFPMGVMGEAGPEAIMPLVNRGGRLGVEAANDGLKEEIRALRQEMAAMRSASERTARATEDSRDVLEGAARGQLSITTEAA